MTATRIRALLRRKRSCAAMRTTIPVRHKNCQADQEGAGLGKKDGGAALMLLPMTATTRLAHPNLKRSGAASTTKRILMSLLLRQMQPSAASRTTMRWICLHSRQNPPGAVAMTTPASLTRILRAIALCPWQMLAASIRAIWIERQSIRDRERERDTTYVPGDPRGIR
jgi:hypothetical protein